MTGMPSRSPSRPRDARDGLGRPEEPLGGELAEPHQHARADRPDLRLEEGLAGEDLVRLGVAVLRRPAFQDVPDPDVGPLHLHALLDDVGQELSRAAHEREALLVLFGPRRLAHEHQLRAAGCPGRRRSSSGPRRACSAGSRRGPRGSRPGRRPGRPCACRPCPWRAAPVVARERVGPRRAAADGGATPTELSPERKRPWASRSARVSSRSLAPVARRALPGLTPRPPSARRAPRRGCAPRSPASTRAARPPGRRRAAAAPPRSSRPRTRPRAR